ncbi:MAG: hypothetical protein AAF587_30660 [Bacteroidota bacterium]
MNKDVPLTTSWPTILSFVLLVVITFCPFSLKGQDVDISISTSGSAPPFVANWQADPNITVVNIFSQFDQPKNLIILVELTEINRGLVASAESEVINLPPGPFQLTIDNTQWTQYVSYQIAPDLEQTILQTGRLPDGSYTVCFWVFCADNNEMLGENCADLEIFHQPNLLLIQPFFNQEVNDPIPFFQWSAADFTGSSVFYKVVIVQRFEDQVCQEAVANNPAVYEGIYEDEFAFYYPEWAVPLEEGLYCWFVQPCDQFGNPISPPSEVWPFVYLPWDRETNDSLPVPGLDSLPITTYDDCLLVPPKTEAASPIAAEIVLQDPDVYPYPRAVPLRGMGVDYDIAVWRCDGCQGSMSELKKVVRDDILSYKWSLESPLGSLDAGPSLAAIKAKQAEIEEEKKACEKLRKELETLEKELANWPEEEKKIKKQIAELESQIEEEQKELDKLIAEQMKPRRDSLVKIKSRVDSISLKLTKRNKTLDSTRAEIDTLEAVIAGKPWPSEASKLEEVGQARSTKEDLVKDLKSLQEKIKSESQRLNQAILDAEDDMRSAAASYNSSRNAAVSLAKTLDDLEEVLYKDPIAGPFFERRLDWQNKSTSFISAYASGSASLLDKLETTDDKAIEALSTSISSERSSKLVEFTALLTAYETSIFSECGSSSSCLGAAAMLHASGAEMTEKLTELLDTDYVLDPEILISIDSLKTLLGGSKPAMVVSTSSLNGKTKIYLAAVKAFTDVMDGLEAQKQGLLASHKKAADDLSTLEFAYQALVQKRKDSLDNMMPVHLKNLLGLNQMKDGLVGEIEHAEGRKATSFAQGLRLNSALDVLMKDSVDREENIGNLKDLVKQLQDFLKKDPKAEKEKQKKDKAKELADCQKKVEDLEEELRKLVQPSSIAEGDLVYYVPPPLEEIFEAQGRLPEFDTLKNAVEKARDTVQFALDDKQSLQKKLTRDIDKISKELVKYKLTKEQKRALEEEKKELDDELLSTEATKRKEYQAQKDKMDKANAKADKSEKDSEKAEKEFESEKKDAEDEVEELKRKIHPQQAALKTLSDDLKDKESQLNYHKKLLNNSDKEQEKRSNTLKEARKNLEAASANLERAQNELTRATAQGDPTAINAAKAEVLTVKPKVALAETALTSAESKLTSIQSSHKSNETAVRNADSLLQETRKKHEIASKAWEKIRDSLIKANQNYEEKLTGEEEMKKRKEEAKETKKKTAKSLDVDKALTDDEDLKQIKTRQKEVDVQLSGIDKKLKDILHTINDSLKRKSEQIEDAKEKLEKARLKLEAKEKVLYDWLLKEFETVSFEVKLKLTVEDAGVDKWRVKDGTKIVTKTMKYEGSRIPVLPFKLLPGPPVAANVNSVCLPAVGFEPPGPPSLKEKPKVIKSEPRTLALLYEQGKILWKEWPVIETSELLAKDVIPLAGEFNMDSDVVKYGCTTDKQCALPPPIADGIKDIGTYSWTLPGIERVPYSFSNWALWEPLLIPPIKLLQEVKPKEFYTANEISGDPVIDGEGKLTYKAGVMIEVTDSLLNLPTEVDTVRARIVSGDHKPMEGESITFTVKLDKGKSKTYGFKGGQKKITQTTDADGYAKVPFTFGEDYARFTITAEWDREKKKVECLAETPLYLQITRFASSAPVFAWEKALELYDAGSALTDASLEAAVAGFPKIDPKAKKDPYENQLAVVAGIVDNERDWVNEKDLFFKKITAGIGLDPQKKATSVIGIARSTLTKYPRKTDLEIAVHINPPFKELGRPEEVKTSYSGEQIKEFKIGNKKNLFTIVLDEPVSKGEVINGTGRLGVGTGGVNVFFKKLMKLSLNLSEVQLDEEGKLAVDGLVSWIPSSPLKTELYNFTLYLDSLMIRPAGGAGLGGNMSHPTALPDPVAFVADMTSKGDFLGKVQNLPTLTISDFKLKKGTAFSLDMHKGISPAGMEGGFVGIVIHQASLELPPSFQKANTKEPSFIQIKDFEIGNKGFGGSLTYEGTVFELGYAGYVFEADRIHLEFERNKLTGGSFKGMLSMPKPMDGKVVVEIGRSGKKWQATGETKKPVFIPRLDTQFDIKRAQITYDEAKDLGSFEMKHADIQSKYYKPISIKRFYIDSEGTIDAQDLKVNKGVSFGTGFDLYCKTVSFSKVKAEYKLDLNGHFSFNKIGVKKVIGTASLTPGPELSVSIKAAKIHFKRGPFTFDGLFAYKGREFKGAFEVQSRGMASPMEGQIVLGNREAGTKKTYSYWYVVLGIPASIPMGQTGLSINKLGGGVGWNYSPPIGSQAGSPTFNESLSFRAYTQIGDATGGKLFNSRFTMVYEPGKFALNGRAWVLQKRNSMYGEGQLNYYWSPTKIDGYLKAVVGTPNASGKVFRFNGKIRYVFSSSQKRIRSERLDGALLDALTARGNVDISSKKIALDASTGFVFDKKYAVSSFGLKLYLNVGAAVKADYINATQTFSSTNTFEGDWDVDLLTPVKNFDIVSGSTDLSLHLKASPSLVRVHGTAKVSWSTWVHSGSKSMEVEYKSGI